MALSRLMRDVRMAAVRRLYRSISWHSTCTQHEQLISDLTLQEQSTAVLVAESEQTRPAHPVERVNWQYF